ncbi:MAG: peroxiredoxin, partial [Candidatus Uhrbacteria bacterium]|nr:peroxiredoxin [Candidatus Uhrbacteria bacterium]
MPIAPLETGMKAPNFRLKDQNGREINLSDFKGKQSLVLIFYPGDLTPGCTMQLCAVRDDWSKFRANEIMVFGVNHADGESHKKFIKKYTFPFPLLIDAGKKVSARYGATKPMFKATVIKR